MPKINYKESAISLGQDLKELSRFLEGKNVTLVFQNWYRNNTYSIQYMQSDEVAGQDYDYRGYRIVRPSGSKSKKEHRKLLNQDESLRALLAQLRDPQIPGAQKKDIAAQVELKRKELRRQVT